MAVNDDLSYNGGNIVCGSSEVCSHVLVPAGVSLSFPLISREHQPNEVVQKLERSDVARTQAVRCTKEPGGAAVSRKMVSVLDEWNY